MSTNAEVFRPDWVVAPGATLEEWLAEAAMSQAELASRLGMSAKAVNQIVRGHVPISQATALKLETVTAIPAGIWNRLEADYREGLARLGRAEQLGSETQWLTELPVAELRKRGLVSATKRDPGRLVEQCLKFFGVANVDAWRQVWTAPQAAYRKSPTLASTPGDLATWLRLGELAAENVDTAPFDPAQLNDAAQQLREHITRPIEQVWPAVQTHAASVGVALVVVPNIGKTRASGATRWVGGRPIVQLSGRFKTDDQIWFALGHELGHVTLHSRQETFVDDGGDGDDLELEADQFASEWLIPDDWTPTLANVGPTAAAVSELASRMGVPAGVLVGRLQHDRRVPRSHLNRLKRKVDVEQLTAYELPDTTGQIRHDQTGRNPTLHSRWCSAGSDQWRWAHPYLARAHTHDLRRVNCNFKTKPSGLIVDYVGIAEDLRSELGDHAERDQAGEELGEDPQPATAPAPSPAMLATHGVVRTILDGMTWRTMLASGDDKAFLCALTVTVEYPLAQHPGRVENPCRPDNRCLRCRSLGQTRTLVQLFTICSSTEQAHAIRDGAACFVAVRGQIGKVLASDAEDGGSGAELDTAIRQIVSKAMSGSGVVNIYAEAGRAQPDVSLSDADFVRRFQTSPKPNLQIDVLRQLLSQEIGRVGRRNIVAGRDFSDTLAASLLKYQNHTLDAAQVIAELAALAQHLKAEQERGTQLGLTEDELAFYDAIRTNDAAVVELGDDTLRQIAHELVDFVRRDAKTDRAVKEQVRAKLRATIRRLLLRRGHPPDQEARARALVLEQAEVIAGGSA